jgi:hypothetical protein
MTGEKIMTQVTGQGPGVLPLTNIVIKWALTSPINNISTSEVFFGVDLSLPIDQVRQSLRDQTAAYITSLTGQAFTALDVISLDDLLEQSYGLAPITVVISSLVVSDDINRVLIPTILNHPNVTIDTVPWSVSAKALVSGTATLVIKNDAGTLLATKAITAAGSFNFTPIVSTINAGDNLHFGFSGIGLGLSDVCVTGWLKVPLGV